MIHHHHIDLLLHGLPPDKRPDSLTKRERSFERVLNAVRAGNKTCNQVSSVLDMSPKYAAKLLDEMHADGVLTRSLHTTNSRKVYIYRIGVT